MTVRGFARAALATWAAALLLLAPWGLQADEAGKTIKIGVVYDLTGRFTLMPRASPMSRSTRRSA